MRVVTPLSGRVTWLFETSELNPRGLSLHHACLELKTKYSFSTPKTREEIDAPKSGIKFENGIFKPSGSDGFTVQLTIFNDGLVAEAWAGTDYAEDFLNDAMNFAQKQLGLTFSPDMIRRKRYGSSLLVESEIGLAKLSDLLGATSASLSAATGSVFGVNGITLAPDPTVPTDGVVPFMIERRNNVPWATNRFFSSAPLQTDQHESLLRQLEESMA